MIHVAVILILAFGDRIERSIQRLFVRTAEVPASETTAVQLDPMEGAKRLMLLFYAVALGGLSLLFFPKPISPYLDGISIDGLSIVVLCGWLSFTVWNTSRRMRGLSAKPAERVVIGLVFIFIPLFVRAMVFSPR